ncbi:hypothetical protein EKO04_008084 [Ascochyta lentis]|uniref:Uncharacterized protein n=1 Tax=Ascochyta lentis TaxID=205686 RepID=A0A8H7IWD3_9PLEO|nr:hypothetical protein EKO04_008084 [Ascochyta lentis]
MTALPELTPLAVAAAIDDFAASPQRGLAAFERLRSAAQPIHGEVLARKRGRRGGWHAGRDDKENADALVTRFWVAAVYHGLHAHLEQSIEEFVGAAAGPLLAPRIRGVARVSETWGADFWAVLRRQGIHLQSDPSNSLVDQLAATARYYDDIEVFAADFTPFYTSHHTRGRPASVNVVTATNVKNFLTWSLDMSLKPMPTLHLSRAVSPTTPVASLQKRLPSQPPEEREETGHGTAEIRPRKLAKTPSAATSPRANIQQLTVAPSQSGANIQQLTVASLQRISINSLLADEDDLQSQPAYGTLSKSTRAVELPCGLSEYVKACQTAKVSTKARFDDLHLKLGLVPPPTPSLSVLQKEIAKLETRIQRQKDKIVAITDDLPDQETSFSLPDQATIFLTAIHDELARLKRVVTEDTERRDQLQEVARQIGPP